MPIGSTQTILVCVPSAFAQAPCPAGMAVSTIQGYVLDASQASNVEAQYTPFDYEIAAGFWSAGFVFVVGLFLVTKSAGVILNRIKG